MSRRDRAVHRGYLLLIRLSIRLEGYPAWLGILGAIIGAVTLTAAVGLYLRPSLFPGALCSAVSWPSVVAQLWLAAVGVVMLRRGLVRGSCRRGLNSIDLLITR